MTELVRLADFLRDKCARNQYGVRYLNHECTLVYVPWPQAPRKNEELPIGFHLYHEWAVLSHLRHHKITDANLVKEAPTLQKHRFRNALSKANGIEPRPDISVEGGKVYQLLSTSRSPESIRSVAASSDGGYKGYEYEANQRESDIFLQNKVPVNVPSTFASSQPFSPNDLDESIFKQLNAAPMPTDHDVDEIIRTVIGEDGGDFIDYFDVLDGNQYNLDVNHHRVDQSPPFATCAYQQLQQCLEMEQSVERAPVEAFEHLQIKLRFRQEEISRFHVTNENGCRVYYGTNIPDISQLVDRKHMQDIMSFFRFDQDSYFGPEAMQQVKLPEPDKHLKAGMQLDKTKVILNCMNRGLILWLDHSSSNTTVGIPNVYAVRLCQTRIFRVQEKGFEMIFLHQPSGLPRMQCTKVFDASSFCQKIADVDQGDSTAKYPNPTFTLSLGQRAMEDDQPQMFASLNVTVKRAQQFIQSKLDSKQEICISYVTSMDEEAHQLSRRLKDIVTL